MLLPSLIEPNTKFFLNERLKQCHNTRANIYSIIINISVIFIFLFFILLILYNIYINKPTEEEQKQQNYINQLIIMNKIKEFRTVPAKITNLTNDYNPFDLLPNNKIIN